MQICSTLLEQDNREMGEWLWGEEQEVTYFCHVKWVRGTGSDVWFENAVARWEEGLVNSWCPSCKNWKEKRTAIDEGEYR
jgi:hypothetical protein